MGQMILEPEERSTTSSSMPRCHFCVFNARGYGTVASGVIEISDFTHVLFRSYDQSSTTAKRQMQAHNHEEELPLQSRSHTADSVPMASPTAMLHGAEPQVHPFPPYKHDAMIYQDRSLLRRVLVLLASGWIWETVSFLAGGAFFGIFLWLLFKYDGKLVETWADNAPISGLFKTLPAAISFLATLMRGAMLYPVLSAMGQLKWHHFRRTRPVYHFEVIDKATRGYLGSFFQLLSGAAL
jgi:hypothetical protein